MRLPVLICLLSCGSIVQAQGIPVGAGMATESFDTLAATGSSSTLPNDWQFFETGGNQAYDAGTGSANGGGAYSFGATGSSERALGSLGSNSVTAIAYGARLRNATAGTLTQLEIAYTGEQWRLGDVNGADRLNFQYCVVPSCAIADAANAAGWTDFDALDFVSPTTGGAAGSALDGNAAANRTAITATLSGIAIDPNETFLVRWFDVNDPGADDGLAIDDVRFGAATDVPPTVTSSVPAPGATGVAVGANLTVNFSEPVDVLPPWFTITCTSGPREAMVSGGPTTYSLDPDSDFAFSESCTLTVLASGVRDRDGTLDPMAANYVATFTTTADLAPTVLSTIPADNATQVAPNTNITINFSEPVFVVDPLATATCTTSGPLNLMRSGGPTSWVLDPSADLAFEETCTVTVRAAAVTDLDGTATPMMADYVFDFTVRAEAGNYYAGVDASSCQALRASLHELIDDHTVLAYTTPPPDFQPTTNTWTMLEEADQDPNNPARVLDVYRNRSYAKVTDRAGGSTPNDGTRYNREHTWPRSLGFRDEEGTLGFPSAPHNDGHMLHLSATDWNADRGNKPYASCPPPGCGSRGTDAQPAPFDGSGGTCSYAQGNCNWVQSPDGNTGSFEPWRKRLGDMARAVLYMDVRYEGGVATGGNTTGQAEPDLVVTDNRDLIAITSASPAYMGLRSDLLAWHAADPPTEHDVLRNDVIQSYQGNRNPFVDRPEWVAIAFQQPCLGTPERIFGDGFETPPP
jgi:endonuclease I/methionine-rich copper-binding protein CopC